MFWVRESGPVQLQLTLVRFAHKLSPFFLLKLLSHAYGRRNCYNKVMVGTHLLLDKMKRLQENCSR